MELKTRFEAHSDASVMDSKAHGFKTALSRLDGADA